MRKGDRKYLNDYTRNPGVPSSSPDAWIYTGKKYGFIFPGEAKKAKAAMCFLSASALLLFFAAALTDSRAVFTPWVFLPYAVCFLPAAFLTGNSFMLLKLKTGLTRRQYEKNILGEKRLSVFLTVTAGISAAADAVMYFVSDAGFMPADVLFSCSCVFMLFAGTAGILLAKKLDCRAD